MRNSELIEKAINESIKIDNKIAVYGAPHYKKYIVHRVPKFNRHSNAYYVRMSGVDVMIMGYTRLSKLSVVFKTQGGYAPLIEDEIPNWDKIANDMERCLNQ